MQVSVVLVQARYLQQLEAALDVLLPQLELRPDLVDLAMVQPAHLERVDAEVLAGIGQAQTPYRPEKAGAQDHLDVERVLHPLEVVGRVLHDHTQALLDAQIVIVDGLEEGAADAELLVGGQDEHLGDGEGRLGHFLELIEGGRVRHELVVHVDEEVVPEGIEWDEAGALDVKLQDGLQMAIQVGEAHLLRVHPVHFEDFGSECGVRRLELALLHFSLGPFGDHGGVQTSKETVGLLDLDLPRELRDELAQRAELLILVPHDLYEGVPVRDQTYQSVSTPPSKRRACGTRLGI